MKPGELAADVIGNFQVALELRKKADDELVDDKKTAVETQGYASELMKVTERILSAGID